MPSADDITIRPDGGLIVIGGQSSQWPVIAKVTADCSPRTRLTSRRDAHTRTYG
jgi:hypothetical protein